VHKVCRICFDCEGHGAEAHDNPLISPCLCAGSSRYVHRKCLQQWRETSKASGRSQAFYRCEVCHYEYRYVRLDGAAFLSHPAVVGATFAALLLAVAALLGFVPLVQACLGAYAIPFTGAAHVAVHLADGLLVLGLVSFVLQLCVARQCRAADHCPAIWFCPDCGPAAADCAGLGAGCGEVCGPLILLALVAAAVVGLLAVVPASLKWLYGLFDAAAGATVAMVENVASPQKAA